MNNIYIFGHKKPDTDSVTSAICLSNLKNKLGLSTVPMVLGEANNETKFVLDHFKVEMPKYLNDVKLQIKDLNYYKGKFVNNKHSILYSFNYMNENGISNIPVVDEANNFLGDISMKDIAKNMICENNDYIEASFDNIVKTISGEEVLRFDDHINGNILVASYRSTTFIENVKIDNETIIIVGDRHSIIEYAINSKAKLIILTGNSKIHNDHIEIAKTNKVNIIRTDMSTFNSAKLITLSKNVETMIRKENIVCFDENDEVNDFVSIANKTKFSYFPVINKDGKCLGLIKLSDVADKNKKKVILVDHNEYEQSVDGLDEAEIMEIVDHHKIGSIGTSAPINFRNMPVGSTNTVIYMLYKENGIEISEKIAGLMMSGIISDTLLFTSPTTTQLDKDIVVELSNIAKVDYKDFGMKMFTAGSTLKGKTIEEIFYTDFKNFDIDGLKIGVSQISTVSSLEILNNSEKYEELINKIAKNNEYHIVALFVTDILKNGSYIYYNNSAHDILRNCFSKELVQGKFLDGLVSRKKQFIPMIMERIAK